MTPLSSRIEKAEGASRALDCELAVAVDGFFIDGERYGEPRYCYIDKGGGQVSPGHSGDMLVRPYTASLDAALALVASKLPGGCWSVHKIPCLGGHYYEADIADRPSFKGRGRTPALALLTALLRALETQ